MPVEKGGKKREDADERARLAWKEGIERLEKGVRDPSNTHPAIVAYRELLQKRGKLE